MGWYTTDELYDLGLKSVGKKVLVSTGATFYRPERISIGDYSRIDDSTTLTAGPNGSIAIGSYVYLGPYVMVESPLAATFGDFSTLAARVTVYGASDNYLGESLTNPTVPPEYRELTNEAIHIGRHAIIGTHSVVLPGAHVGDGCAVGAMTLVNRTLEPFGVYVGAPARRIRERSRRILELESELAASASRTAAD